MNEKRILLPAPEATEISELTAKTKSTFRYTFLRIVELGIKAFKKELSKDKDKGESADAAMDS